MVGKFRNYFIIFGILVVLSMSILSAADIGNKLHLNIQTTDTSTGEIVTGTFNFVFNITTDSSCSNVVYSDSATLTTDNRGIISYYLEDVNLDFTQQYYLCYYRDGTLINNSLIARSPYSFTAKNSTVSGLIIDSNLGLGSYNLTAAYIGIGLTSPSYRLDISGSMRASGNIFSGGFVNATTDVCIEGGNCLSNVLASYSESDPYWTDNFTKYNASWTTTDAEIWNVAGNGTLAYLSDILGFGYYNLSDFNINDYYLKSNPFHFWNDTYASFNKTYADTLYPGFVYVDSLGNFSAWDKDYTDLINVPTHLSNFTDDILWTSSFNATGDSRWLSSSGGEIDPYWTGNWSSRTGTGNVVYSNSPTLVTPTLGVATATTLNTGQGDYELYAMNQNVRTTDAVTFTTVNTGLGAMEVGDTAITSGDTAEVPTSDAVYNFVTSQGYLASESDPYWTDNFTKYNASWTSTYNSTYDTWAYNQTIPAIAYADANFLRNDGDNGTGVYNFGGSWSEGGLTIKNGDLYAQTVYVYNISSLQVSDLNINGSLYPQEGFDNTFDVGSPSRRWRNAHFGEKVYVNGSFCIDQDCISSWSDVNSSESDPYWTGNWSSRTGTGNVVYSNSPTLVTPTLGVATATTLNTGQGDYELYAMNQNVRTTDAVTFTTVNTGNGAKELGGGGTITNGDTTHLPTEDNVYDFVTSQGYLTSVDDVWVNESGDTMSGTLNMNSNTIINIGNSGTDFTSAGGLTLAGTFDPNGAITLPTTGISGAGPGSGLNADLLDGHDSSYFATAASSGDITSVNTNGIYLTGGATSGDVNLLLDEAQLNSTIDARDSDTTYSSSGTLLDLSGTVFSVNEGTLTNGKYCTYVSGTGLVCNSDAGVGTLTGVGTSMRIPLWNGTTSLNNSEIYQGTSGRIGIGRASPSVKLDVDTGSNSGGLRLRGTAETSEIGDIYVGSTGQMIISTTAGTDSSGHIELRPEDNSYGLVIKESDGTGTTVFSNMYVTDAADDYLSINLNSVKDGDALIVTASNRVGVGTYTPKNKLNVIGDINSTSNIYSGSGVFINGSLYMSTTGSLSSTLADWAWDPSGENLFLTEPEDSNKIYMGIYDDNFIGMGVGSYQLNVTDEDVSVTDIAADAYNAQPSQDLVINASTGSGSIVIVIG